MEKDRFEDYLADELETISLKVELLKKRLDKDEQYTNIKLVVLGLLLTVFFI